MPLRRRLAELCAVRFEAALEAEHWRRMSMWAWLACRLLGVQPYGPASPGR